jgi:hypothetical protein
MAQSNSRLNFRHNSLVGVAAIVSTMGQRGKAEGKRQKAGGRRQKAEGRGQKVEG